MFSRHWRITHVLSHHQYPNSFFDFDVIGAEPLYSLYPDAEGKNWFKRFGSWIYVPIFYLFIFHINAVKHFIDMFKRNFRVEWEDLIPFIIPTVLIIFTSTSYWEIFKMWNFILSMGSFTFASLGFLAGHYHPDNVFDGDALR